MAKHAAPKTMTARRSKGRHRARPEDLLTGGPSRRAVAAGALGATAAAAVTTAATGTAAHAEAGRFLIGRAIRDMTGESAAVGFFGYGDSAQTGLGIHMRQHARAFVVEDPSTGDHVALVITDQLCPSDGMRQEVLRRLQAQAPGRWTQSNVAIGGTHSHATPGGAGFDELHNVTTLGFQTDTFEHYVSAVVEAILAADADRASGQLTLSRSELSGASVNRSMKAFQLNPADLREALPDGLDRSSVSLRFQRGGADDAVINWFAVHSTSLPTTNRLVSSDNKGYAEWSLERSRGTDHLAQGRPPFVAAFANPNSGDVSPNLNLRPGSGPTEDPFENMRILGQRQADAVSGQLGQVGQAVQSGLDHRIVYVDMSAYEITPEFSGTGRTERTGPAVLGTAFGAGSTEDGGGGLSLFKEGLSGNPFSAAISSWRYSWDTWTAAIQAPKSPLLPVGAMGWVQQRVPVQLIRLGQVWIAVMPGELTGAAGVLYRRAIARVTGAREEDVIVQGTSNGYSHYVTTPEEYESQHYEGAATMYGKHSASAYCQILSRLARSMVDGQQVPLGQIPADESASALRSLQGWNGFDVLEPGMDWGKVIEQPAASITGGSGQPVQAVFAGANPNNDMRHGDSYLRVEQLRDGQWVRVRDDNHWDTKFIWEDRAFSRSRVTLRWTPPAGETGTFRFVYRGARKLAFGAGIRQISGTSRSFQVV